MTKKGPVGRGATWDREATEATLEAAALKLLDENGILSGLNLRQVADEAGVNRGLVYHYFGGGRDLLRSALRKDIAQRLGALRPDRGHDFRQRAKRVLGTMIDQAESLRLVVILMLDHDERVRVLALKDEVVPELHERQASGEIRADVDIVAFHALQVASNYGYALLREALASELEVDLDELDRRVVEIAGRIGGLLEPDGDDDR